MSGPSSKRILFLNGLTDSENDSESENVDNFTLKKKEGIYVIPQTQK